MLRKYFGTDKVADPNYWGDDLAKAIVMHEYYANQADSAPVCSMNSFMMNLKKELMWKINDLGDFMKYSMNGTAEYLSAVFGEKIIGEDLFARDEMLVNLERAIWIRDGYTKGAVDTFFDCIFEETDLEGNILIPRDKFENVLNIYYKLRDWKNGVPTRAKLEKLDLRDIADELEERGVAATA
jgi:aldehyde:ferredoxin oxidoreductase